MATEGQSSEERIAVIEAYWSLVARITAFFFGMALLGFNAAFMSGEDWQVRSLFALVGVACMGPASALTLAGLIDAARGNGRRDGR